MRFFFLALVILALGGAAYLWLTRLGGSDSPVWIDLGSLLRLQPGRETLYQYEEASACFLRPVSNNADNTSNNNNSSNNNGSFLALARFSAFNAQVRGGAIDQRLVLYLRNDNGNLLALVVRDPGNRETLTVNLGQPGFASRDGARRWDRFGQSLRKGQRPLTKLESSLSGANIRVNLKPVLCPAAPTTKPPP
jgi:hypothetical protein